MKTALVVGLVVVVFALVVTLALPVFGPVLDQFAESWVVGGLIFLRAIVLVLCAIHGIGVGGRHRSGVAHSPGEMRCT